MALSESSLRCVGGVPDGGEHLDDDGDHPEDSPDDGDDDDDGDDPEGEEPPPTDEPESDEGSTPLFEPEPDFPAEDVDDPKPGEPVNPNEGNNFIEPHSEDRGEEVGVDTRNSWDEYPILAKLMQNPTKVVYVNEQGKPVVVSDRSRVPAGRKAFWLTNGKVSGYQSPRPFEMSGSVPRKDIERYNELLNQGKVDTGRHVLQEHEGSVKQTVNNTETFGGYTNSKNKSGQTTGSSPSDANEGRNPSYSDTHSTPTQEPSSPGSSNTESQGGKAPTSTPGASYWGGGFPG